jgi:peptidyl-dipeptidase A
MKRLISATSIAVILACAISVSAQSTTGTRAKHPATAAGVKAFLKEVDRELLRLINASNRAGWVQSTYITPDTELIAAQANEALVTAATNYAKDAFRFDKLQVSAAERRQLTLLKNALTVAAPPDPKEAEELTRLVASMEGAYGSGKYCPKPNDCIDIEKITEILAENRDPKRLQEVWEGWHTISIPMRNDYARFVELSNKGASVLGFKDTGAMWRGKYDMPADAFAQELDRLDRKGGV